jgi:hypothetical protein
MPLETGSRLDFVKGHTYFQNYSVFIFVIHGQSGFDFREFFHLRIDPGCGLIQLHV